LWGLERVLLFWFQSSLGQAREMARQVPGLPSWSQLYSALVQALPLKQDLEPVPQQER